MELTYGQVDPNMNAEEYRNLSAADRPPVPDKQLQVIKVFKGEIFRLSLNIFAAFSVLHRVANNQINT